MDGARWTVDPPAALSDSPLDRRTDRPKPNRLSRSFRQKQAVECESPKSQQSDFKTPTRILRSKPAGGSFSQESPHNDSDVQLDIFWDATSPSPHRRGKRGKKHAAGVMNISEIVRRIAPKHGRPEVSEPTLQQWIRDIATIPCTPDVQVPKPKKKSQRPSGLDDLLKLAQQFDLNMFCQEEEEEEVVEEEEEEEEEVVVEEQYQLSPELLSEDILQAEVHNKFTGMCPPAVSSGTDVQDEHMDDDLDFLFDGPTQRLSGNISQALSQVKPAVTLTNEDAFAKPPTLCLSDFKRTPVAADDFEDDWENDDLLNDSLLLEMTQNPQNFAAPKHCSTQKPAVGLGQLPWTLDKDNMRPVTTLKVECDPDSSVNRQTRTNWDTDYSPSTVKPEPQKSHHVTPGSLLPASKTTQSFQKKPEVTISHRQAAPDFMDEDLDSFFSSEPVWDDPADDYLLFEMCEDLENQIQDTTAQTTTMTRSVGSMSTQRSALQPVNRIQRPLPQKQMTASSASGRPVGSSLVALIQVTESTRVTQNVSGLSVGSMCLQASSRVQQHTNKNQFTFKKPNKPVSSVTNYAVAQCSAAEIELKKQQAIERRRQRLQAAQNLRVQPTRPGNNRTGPNGASLKTESQRHGQ